MIELLNLNQSIAGPLYAFIILFLVPFCFTKKRIWQILLIALIGFFLFLLFKSNSRSGWLGLTAGFIFIIERSFKHRKKRRLVLPVGLLFFSFLFAVLFFYKKNSSTGRLHIYSLSAEILKDNWRSGIGPGKFEAVFNEYQAAYFSEHTIDSQRALLADNTFYAFNDLLQFVIETGIAGLLILLLIVYFLVTKIRSINSLVGDKPIISAAIAGLICIGTASLFSHPLQTIHLQAMALLSTGIITFYPVKRKFDKMDRAINVFSKSVFLLLAVLFIIISVRTFQRKKGTKDAFDLVMAGYRNEAIIKYETLVKKYPAHGDIMYLYAEQLYYSNRLPEALLVIKKAGEYYVDNKLYGLKAKINDELGQKKEAEKNYLHSLYMVPNRMGSRFDLLHFYLNEKDTAKSIYWANSILNMKVKVPSERTENMLQETTLILGKLKK